MKKRSGEYWKDRFLNIEKASNAYGVEAFRQIEPAFDEAQRAIQREIERWYSRYAKNNQISITEARKALTAKELKELRWDVNEYIKKGRENAFNGKWVKELENASARVHISRLEALKIRTQQAAEVAFGNELDVIDDMARRVYTEDYYRSIFEMQKGFNIGWDIGTIDQKKLDKLITKPWTADNKTFSDRIWQTKNQMVSELHNQLTRTCVLGKSPDKAIEALIKYVDKDIENKKYVAGRLVMTEQAYFHSVAQRDAFNDLDVEEFEIVATLDSHTSQVCQDMDGTHLPMSQYEPGVTAPPFHVFCRSVTVPYFEDNFTGERAARGADGKTYYVPDDMTYKDWKKSFVDGKTEDLTPIVDNDKFEEITDAMDFAYGDYTDEDFFKWESEYISHNADVKLTDEELKIIEDYTEGDFIVFNGVSRGLDDKLLKQGYSAEDLMRIRNKADKLEDVLGRYDLDTDIVTHRFERDVSWLTGKGNNIDDLENLIGTEFTTEGFTSSSMFPMRSRFAGGKADAVHFEIITPKGTNGAYLSMSKKGEEEFLYNRGTKFKVLDGGERIVKEQKLNIKTMQMEEVEIKERFLKVQVIPDVDNGTKGLTNAHLHDKMKMPKNVTSNNIGVITKAKDTSDFDGLADYLDSTYGIKMDDSVKQLDFGLVRDGLEGVEEVISEYPDVGTNLTEAITGYSGVMSCSGENLVFNPFHFTDKQYLVDKCNQMSNIKHWIPNSSPKSIGVHEAAHGVEWALIQANPSYVFNWQKTLAWNGCSEAKLIVSQACKNIKKTPYGKGKKKAELIKSISKYAFDTDSETLAEAFADVYANGLNANPLSVEIKRLTKEQMKKYKGVI